MDEIMKYYQKDLSFYNVLYKSRPKIFKYELKAFTLGLLAYVYSIIYAVLKYESIPLTGWIPLVVSIVFFYILRLRINSAFREYAKTMGISEADIRGKGTKYIENKVRMDIKKERICMIRNYYATNGLDTAKQNEIKELLRTFVSEPSNFPIIPAFFGGLVLSLTDKFFGYFFDSLKDSTNGNFELAFKVYGLFLLLILMCIPLYFMLYDYLKSYFESDKKRAKTLLSLCEEA